MTDSDILDTFLGGVQFRYIICFYISSCVYPSFLIYFLQRVIQATFILHIYKFNNII